jgi:hypothetical protein
MHTLALTVTRNWRMVYSCALVALVILAAGCGGRGSKPHHQLTENDIADAAYHQIAKGKGVCTFAGTIDLAGGPADVFECGFYNMNGYGPTKYIAVRDGAAYDVTDEVY